MKICIVANGENLPSSFEEGTELEYIRLENYQDIIYILYHQKFISHQHVSGRIIIHNRWVSGKEPK